MNALLITLLVGFFLVRHAVRRYTRKELVNLPGRKSEIMLGGRW